MKRILRLIAGLCLVSVISGFTFSTPKMHPYAVCVRTCLHENFADSSCNCNQNCVNELATFKRLSNQSGDDYDEGLAACTVQCLDTCRWNATLGCRPSCLDLEP
jgi:hypothetical protein